MTEMCMHRQVSSLPPGLCAPTTRRSTLRLCARSLGTMEARNKGLEREARKVALGMLSSRMQSVERGITGRNRGPAPLAADPQLYSVIPPPLNRADRIARAFQQPEEHPASLRSGTDLLWREGGAQPPPGPRPQRRPFARFVPSHNRGKPTSHNTLEKMAAKKAESVFNRAHAARAPAHLAVRLSKDVLEMCAMHGIDAHALMREGANPLAEHVHVMHGPHTPSWDYALGDFNESNFDDTDTAVTRAPGAAGGRASSLAMAAAARSLQSSARSEPAGRSPRNKSKARSGGSDSARATRTRPPPVLSESETADVQRRVQMEIEQLRKQRGDGMRRVAAVKLAEQRRWLESTKIEANLEVWGDENRALAEQKQARQALAAKRHVMEHEAHMHKVRDKIKAEADAEAQALRKRWKAREVELDEQRQKELDWHRTRSDAQRNANKSRVNLEEKRAVNRAEAVAEYQEARIEGEKEAADRAADHVEEKRQAAEARVNEYAKRREDALNKKHAAASEHARIVQERFEQRLVHDQIIEQQQRERMLIPYRAHEKNREREAMAPIEVKRLEVARERRFETERVNNDEAVEENRKQQLNKHHDWVNSRRVNRQKVVKRIEAANRERASRTEEDAAAIRRFEENVAKLEAKKDLRNKMLKAEREAFRRQQSEMGEAIYRSEVGSAVITDTQLEAVIAGSPKRQGK